MPAKREYSPFHGPLRAITRAIREQVPPGHVAAGRFCQVTFQGDGDLPRAVYRRVWNGLTMPAINGLIATARMYPGPATFIRRHGVELDMAGVYLCTEAQKSAADFTARYLAVYPWDLEEFLSDRSNGYGDRADWIKFKAYCFISALC